ncbi:MAG: hypothetical protein NVSMB32_12450 [Actinomycetota bacterium]
MSIFTKGILAAIGVMGGLFGMVYLLMSMVLGAKLAYWVEAAITFGVLSIMSAIWVFSGLGPVGPSTAFEGIAVGPNVTTVTAHGSTYNLADYPTGPGWKAPEAHIYLADLHGDDDLATEALQAKTVMDGLVGNAVSPIPGVVKRVKSLVQGQVTLQAGSYTETDMRMEAVNVDGKASIIAVSKVVPSQPISVVALPNNAATATIVKYLVNLGDPITKGQDIMTVQLPDNTNANLQSTDAGTVAALGPDVGSLVRANVPILTLDISSHPNQPPAVLVAAVRVRGSLKTPPMIYLIVSLLLFVIHLSGLSRLERARRASMQPA